MKIVIQRVSRAEVRVSDEVVGSIGRGAVILLGIAKGDTRQHADELVEKVLNLRMFDDAAGKMNLSSVDTRADFLVVSQFTLYGNCDKGRRPSFDDAADPTLAEELYTYFVDKLKQSSLKIETGRFRAMMHVELINDGPVTFILEKS